jgi:hypothetical protein
MIMVRVPGSNFIILSGAGKKVGKTYLAVSLIRHFSDQSPIIGLKISPHQHDQLGSVVTIADGSGYRLFRELEVHDKNSGQFFKAGATASYFLETDDNCLSKAIEEFSQKCNPLNLPVVCESGALAKIIKPGVMIYIEHPGQQGNAYKESQRRLADIILPARQFLTSEVISKINLTGNNWFTNSR